jgi:amidohydrolase
MWFVGLAAGQGIAPSSSELDRLEELYVYLHRHPELSFHEAETAGKLISELRPLGFEITSPIGGAGFAAMMKNGDGPTVLIRTDLDALPVQEQTGREYASTVRTTNDSGAEVSVMHACGHDVHMTTFIGVARALAGAKERWKGTLLMIGQPAEERGAGARAMLADGLFTRTAQPDFALALHSSPSLPTGKIGYISGFALANIDTLDVTIRGVGGHGAYPHSTKDPVVIAAYVITALQTIVSRETNPLDSVVVTVGSIHGGTKHNIISDEVKLQLTVRSYQDDVRERTLESIRRITTETARAFGVPADREPTISIDDSEFTPAAYNDPALVERLVPIWRQALGTENVVDTPPVMAGEDFAEYGRTEDDIPAMIFWLGTVDPARVASGEPLPSLHSPFFKPEPRAAVETGVRAMTAAALELLGR